MDGHADGDRIVTGLPVNVFRRCPFTGNIYSDSDSSDSEAVPVESTGIFMLSLPDSMEEKDDSLPHSFQTAPEELAPTGSDGRRSLAADSTGVEVSFEYVDDGKAVDLGRDTDVGLYSEVQSTTETVEKGKTIEVIGARGSHSSETKKSGILFEESVVSLGESSSKKLRLSEEALGLSSCGRTFLDKFPVDLTNSGGSHNDDDCSGKYKLKGTDDGKVSNDENDENQCNYKEKSAEKEVKESVKNIQSPQQNKFQEEIANAHQSCCRVLPPSMTGVKKNAAEERFNTSEDQPIEVTLLKILMILKGEQVNVIEFDDETLSKLSILEIAQLRGMTFPRPEWWPPEY
ncbi:hypothetical protein E5676_scaffold1017G00750 [Cucumis melo var. makuwa]|uniref:Uncharacterized protein n=2 Tax=Cucumis melo TaxID=3656 RepID=A0A5A7TCP7_CUCMM|nr:hypothetical protein E6C27_scaffold477G00220 [Cucumis melo var. makuwa]TYK12060.1 hypothetical protein E5676_scaffold1017G00750 [Cucumis melo var. makuwa]